MLHGETQGAVPGLVWLSSSSPGNDGAERTWGVPVLVVVDLRSVKKRRRRKRKNLLVWLVVDVGMAQGCQWWCWCWCWWSSMLWVEKKILTYCGINTRRLEKAGRRRRAGDAGNCWHRRHRGWWFCVRVHRRAVECRWRWWQPSSSSRVGRLGVGVQLGADWWWPPPPPPVAAIPLEGGGLVVVEALESWV